MFEFETGWKHGRGMNTGILDREINAALKWIERHLAGIRIPEADLLGLILCETCLACDFEFFLNFFKF